MRGTGEIEACPHPMKVRLSASTEHLVPCNYNKFAIEKISAYCSLEQHMFIVARRGLRTTIVCLSLVSPPKDQTRIKQSKQP